MSNRIQMQMSIRIFLDHSYPRIFPQPTNPWYISLACPPPRTPPLAPHAFHSTPTSLHLLPRSLLFILHYFSIHFTQFLLIRANSVQITAHSKLNMLIPLPHSQLLSILLYSLLPSLLHSLLFSFLLSLLSSLPLLNHSCSHCHCSITLALIATTHSLLALTATAHSLSTVIATPPCSPLSLLPQCSLLFSSMSLSPSLFSLSLSSLTHCTTHSHCPRPRPPRYSPCFPCSIPHCTHSLVACHSPCFHCSTPRSCTHSRQSHSYSSFLLDSLHYSSSLIATLILYPLSLLSLSFALLARTHCHSLIAFVLIALVAVTAFTLLAHPHCLLSFTLSHCSLPSLHSLSFACLPPHCFLIPPLHSLSLSSQYLHSLAIPFSLQSLSLHSLSPLVVIHSLQSLLSLSSLSLSHSLSLHSLSLSFIALVAFPPSLVILIHSLPHCLHCIHFHCLHCLSCHSRILAFTLNSRCSFSFVSFLLC